MGQVVDILQGRASLEHGGHRRDVSRVERALAVNARQLGALHEHLLHVGDIVGLEVVVEAESGQTATALEHGPHVLYVLGVPVVGADRSQRGASLEHAAHRRHIVGLEVACLAQVGQLRTVAEHVVHHFRLLGVQVLQTLNLSKAAATVEPEGHILGRLLEARSKDDLADEALHRLPLYLGRVEHVDAAPGVDDLARQAGVANLEEVVLLVTVLHRGIEERQTVLLCAGPAVRGEVDGLHVLAVVHGLIARYLLLDAVVEVIVDVGRQSFGHVGEHVAQRLPVLDLRNELLQIDVLQRGAVVEHTLGIAHVVGHEVVQVEMGQARAAGEHSVGRRQFVGL